MKAAFLKGASLAGFAEVLFYPFLVWMPIYLTHFLQVPPEIAHSTNTVTLIVMAGLQFSMGYISKRIGYKPLLILSILIFLVFIYPLFQLLLHYPNMWLMILSFQLFAALIISVLGGVMMEVLGDLFPDRIRGRGMNITHAVPNVLFGATAPMICTYMIKQGFNTFPIFYAIFFGILALIATFSLKTQHNLKSTSKLI